MVRKYYYKLTMEGLTVKYFEKVEPTPGLWWGGFYLRTDVPTDSVHSEFYRVEDNFTTVYVQTEKALKKSIVYTIREEDLERSESNLWGSSDDCVHEIMNLWSGVKCRYCSGWSCF